MKLKLDENIPVSLQGPLGTLGHDVDDVAREGLAGRPDPDVWEAAQAAGRFLVTQDLDFSDIRRFAPGAHHGLMLVRLRSPGARAVAARVEAVFATERIDSWARCLVIVTERKTRVRRP